MNEHTNGKTLRVHLDGTEGTIEIDALTGIVKTNVDERPEWADGLTCALIQERVSFYFGNDKIKTRLDRSKFEPAIMGAELIDMRDLSWTAIDPETGEAVEVEADADFRMGAVAGLLGIDREDFDATSEYEIEVAHDTSRTTEEAVTFSDVKDTIFPPTAEAEVAAAKG